MARLSVRRESVTITYVNRWRRLHFEARRAVRRGIPGDGTFELTMTDKKRRELQEMIRAGEHQAEMTRLQLRLAAVASALAIQTVEAMLDEMRDALAGAISQQAHFDQTHARLRDLLKAEKTDWALPRSPLPVLKKEHSPWVESKRAKPT
jgi:hypothetical protein